MTSRAVAWRERLEALSRMETDSRAPDALSRRMFLKLMGASVALPGCFDPPERNLLPYTRRPDDVVPGRARTYTTTIEIGGYGIGLLAESREGRPVKLEGNPLHPASLGAIGAYEQASILGLYDPWRVQQLTHQGIPAILARLWEVLESAGTGPGAPLHLLLEPTASPLRIELLERIVQSRPGTKLYFHAPLRTDHGQEVAAQVFGRNVTPLFAFDRAALVLAIDADFASGPPYGLRYAHDFAERRRVERAGASMARFYSVESTPSATGSLADHRLVWPVRRHASLLRSVLLEVSARLEDVPAAVRALEAPPPPTEEVARWIRALAADLIGHRGESLVIVADHEPAEVHALALALNELLGNMGKTVTLLPSVLRGAQGAGESLSSLTAAMRAGEVETLLILGGNPVYSAPADLEFGRALASVPHSIHVSRHVDETARLASWLVPARHYLESWGDARALDGTASLVQPLIRPLYPGTISQDEVLARLAGEASRPIASLLQEMWSARVEPRGRQDEEPPAPMRAAGFSWDEALRRGVIEGTSLEPVQPRFDWEAWDARTARTRGVSPGGLTLEFRADSSVYDGSFADNPWLQELPDPITKLTWDNAAWLAPETAEALGVENGEWLRVEHQGRQLDIPALRVEGQAPGTLTVHLGYGHRVGTPVSEGAGFDAYAIRTSTDPWRAEVSVAPLAALGESRSPYPLARTQNEFEVGERQKDICPVRTLDEVGVHEPPHSHATLFPVEYPGRPQWGMSIDLNLCTGCSACVVACQAENNVPVVGKESVSRGREMHWLRIDRYRTGSPETPNTVCQPMLCQHCETAPCEYVCPVNATVHSPDGLNEMVYNRCVGTRFCSNNCPYKVRRFNWFDFNARVPETRQMQLNPEVTVRARGVMEKCTYCVQRIRTREIEARREGRALEDGEVVTACQQACPTQAIQFGDVADPASSVSRALDAPQTYGVLTHLGTRPRTRYRARLRDPNPQLEPPRPHRGDDE